MRLNIIKTKLNINKMRLNRNEIDLKLTLNINILNSATEYK